MKASRFSDVQKAFIIKQDEDGTLLEAICRQAGISQATYFNRKKKNAGMKPSEMRRMLEFDQEIARLKKIIAAQHGSNAPDFDGGGTLVLNLAVFQERRSEGCPQERIGEIRLSTL